MLSNTLEKKINIAKIMIVDDEEDIVIIIGKVLKKSGYQFTTAVDGLECLKKLENELPDLILLDNVMPNMDGKTVLLKLKASKRTANIPVIMVTALADQEHITSAQKGGAVEYIVKPFDYTVMLKKIAQVLKAK